MGIERDYLMRQIMMLLEVIQKIMGFRKKGQYEQAQEEINYFYNYLKLDKNIRDKSIKDMLDYLVSEKKFSHSQLELIAFVLKEQGELEENSRIRIDFFRKAYFLLDIVDRENTSFSMDRQMKMAELRGYLNGNSQ